MGKSDGYDRANSSRFLMFRNLNVADIFSVIIAILLLSYFTNNQKRSDAKIGRTSSIPKYQNGFLRWSDGSQKYCLKLMI